MIVACTDCGGGRSVHISHTLMFFLPLFLPPSPFYKQTNQEINGSVHIRPWPGSSVGESIIPIPRGCGLDLWSGSGHTQESINERINKWSNTLLLLFPSLSQINVLKGSKLEICFKDSWQHCWGIGEGRHGEQKDQEGYNIFVLNNWVSGAVTDEMGKTGRGEGFVRKFKIPFWLG